MFHFSKSKYILAWICPKLLWLSRFKAEEKIYDPALEMRFEEGNEVGNLAMGLLGDFTEVTAFTEDDKLDLEQMIRNTQECLDLETVNICEASFNYEGLYCAIDILHREKDGYAIYEVKSSTRESQIYAADIAYQKYVLEHCGIHVTGTYLVCINNEYIRGDVLEINSLFKIIDMADSISEEYEKVPGILDMARTVLSSEEPKADLDICCHEPYDCSFWRYCSSHLPSPSVFNVYRMPFRKKLQCYHDGIVSFEDIASKFSLTDDMQKRQIEYYLNDMDVYVDKEALGKYLLNLTYPLYFLDFESEKSVIPLYPGTKPNQQIPFQYSLHYIEYEGGPLLHREFLGISGEDPRRSIAESLVKDIPEDACVVAYNKSFECGTIRGLAELFPDLSEHLLSIESNIVDLIIPFQHGMYYKREMGGSFSIKSVLPAIDSSFDYHNLDQVHNGAEAMCIFPMIQNMTADKQKEARKNLLEYCKMDTLAMVIIWKELLRAAK